MVRGEVIYEERAHLWEPGSAVVQKREGTMAARERNSEPTKIMENSWISAEGGIIPSQRE